MAIAAQACIQVAGSARSGMSAHGGDGELEAAEAPDGAGVSRKDKRKALKKQKRKQIRRELAIREREEEVARAKDPEEQVRIRQKEQDEAEAAERERKAFEEHERLWLEAAAVRRAEEEEKREEELRRNQLLQEAQKNEVAGTDELNGGGDDDWEYAEEGPAEIIWKGNEIIVKKKRVRVKKIAAYDKELDDRPTSNPLPPQSSTFKAFNCLASASAGEMLESVANQVPNFGTEQDKAHCPFHLKTGACRFGSRCSRVHFYPDKSCTLLIKNMYNGPGIVWEQDEGLEYTDEEVEHFYEDFYEDVHTEFLKFGELVNFKVCRNSSFHLRGNVYIQYKNLESAILAYNTMSGRYYAGKQIICEFVNITRWKVAICGEYMKSRLKTCSHGSACNFIHCFYNPGGDYEWADWDSPPPRYWVKKMTALFGLANIPRQDMGLELENELPNEDKRRTRRDRYRSRKDKYKEAGLSSSSGGEFSDGVGDRYRRAGYCHQGRSYSRDRRTVEHCSLGVDGTEHGRHSYDPDQDRGSSHRENRRKDRAEHSRRGHYSGGDDVSDAEDRDSSFRDGRRKSRRGSSRHSHQSYESGDAVSKARDGDSSCREKRYAEGSRLGEHTGKRVLNSSSRSMEKTSGAVRGKSEKKSTRPASPVWSLDAQVDADMHGGRSILDDQDGVAAPGGSGCSSYERPRRGSDVRKKTREHAERSSDGVDSHSGRSKKRHR